MAGNKEDSTPQPRRTYGQHAKQAGLFLLFGTILLIPRLRRLRRRIWAWSFVRLGTAACATWLGWRHTHAGAGLATLVASLLLFAFSLLVRAKPLEKSADALTAEMGALVVLNGGTFRETPDSAPISLTQIFVHPERIIVLGPHEHHLLEIPLARVQQLAAHSVDNGPEGHAGDWAVEINWLAEVPCTTTFHYEGIFAEHLARVTESTLRSQWKKGLPIVPQ